MKDWLIIDPVFTMWGSLLLLVVAVGAIIWKEYYDRRKRILSVVGIILATIGLAGIFLRPSSLTTRNSVTILLTKDYDGRVADSLLREYPQAEVYTAPDVKPLRLRKTTALVSWHELSGIRSVDAVVGEGMPPYALDLLENKKALFVVSNKGGSLKKWITPQAIKANRLHELHGQYLATEPTVLRIDGPGGISDSTNVDKGLARFCLSFSPKNAGPITLTFTEKTNGSEIAHKLGLNVERADKLRILFLQDYPTFESGYLKNFLAQQHAIAVRYRLSRNIFRHEYVNMPAVPQQGITRESLSNFDIVILTPSAILSLGRREKTALESAVQEGLGVLIAGAGNESVAFGPDMKTERVAKDTVHVSLTTARKTILTTSRYLLSSQPRLTPILSQGEKILTGYVNHGFGRIGYSVLTESYPLLLDGDSLIYAKLWIPVLESSARRKTSSLEIMATTRMPFLKDEPLHLEVFTAAGPPEMYYDSVRIPVIEDPMIPNRWNATVWPVYEGWNEIKSESDSAIFSFFVNNRDEWQHLRSQRNADATRISAVSDIGKRSVHEWRRINPIVFYVLFLLGMSWLWLHPKVT